MRHMLSILEMQNKLQHKGIELWAGCMNGVETDQKNMVKYNQRDVKVLEPLYETLLPWIKSHPNVALWLMPREKPMCPKCGSTSLRFKGYKRTSVLSYEQYVCKDCGSYSRARIAEERGDNKRRDILV